MSATSDPSTTIAYRYFDIQHDFNSLVTLLQQVEQADNNGEDVSENALREQLTWFGHNPNRDRWIATSHDGSELVGYGAVHPAYRRRGIATHLLAYLHKRLYEVNVKDMRVYASLRNKAANAFLHTYGFTPRSTYTRMTIPTTQVFPPSTFPLGFFKRRYVQLQLFMQAINTCYEGMWGHHNINAEEMSEWLPTLTPEGIFLLFAPDNTIVGIIRAEASDHLSELRGVPTGLIDAPGVVPAYRDNDLYSPLLLTALQWLAPQKLESIELESWGDAPETLALYQHLGFTITQVQVSYHQDLK